MEVALFALGALMLGVVIFGGTTLAYFVGKRTPGSPEHAGIESLHRAPGRTTTSEPTSALNDEAA